MPASKPFASQAQWSASVHAPDASAADHEDAVDLRVFDAFREGGNDDANDFVVELIHLYLSESASRMSALRDAVDRRDAPAVAFIAHGLKGSSGAVGANRMASICGEMETLARNATLDGGSALVSALDDELERVRHALLAEQGRVG